MNKKVVINCFLHTNLYKPFDILPGADMTQAAVLDPVCVGGKPMVTTSLNVECTWVGREQNIG